MQHLCVIYNPVNGVSYADGLVKEQVQRRIELWRGEANTEGNPIYNCWVIGSQLMIDEIRLQVALGVIEHQAITFMMSTTNKQITCDEHGTLSEWPKGFCDYQSNVLCELARKRTGRT